MYDKQVIIMVERMIGTIETVSDKTDILLISSFQNINEKAKESGTIKLSQNLLLI